MSERSRVNSLDETRIVTRRKLFIGAAATLFCGPSIVRASSLMPVRGVIFPIERHHYGFVERFCVHTNFPTIQKLQHAGFSAHGIAAAMNSLGRKSINDAAWDAESVIGVIERDKRIRREDAIWRAEKMQSSS